VPLALPQLEVGGSLNENPLVRAAEQRALPDGHRAADLDLLSGDLRPGQLVRPNPQEGDDCGTIPAWLRICRVRAALRRETPCPSGRSLHTSRTLNLRSGSPGIERSSRLACVPRCGRIADGAEQQSGP